MSRTPVKSMGELERLSQHLGAIVHYDSVNGMETLAYSDGSSQIAAAQYPDGAKAVSYHVDIAKVEFYASNLRGVNSAMSKRIQEALKPRIGERPPTDGSQHLAGDNFDVENFSELSDIILLHKKIA